MTDFPIMKSSAQNAMIHVMNLVKKVMVLWLMTVPSGILAMWQNHLK